MVKPGENVDNDNTSKTSIFKSKRTMQAKTGNQIIPSYVYGGFVDEAIHNRLTHLVAPHVDSFNYFLEYGIQEAIQDIPPFDIKIDENLYITLKYSSIHVGYPSRKEKEDLVQDDRLTPREARERGLSYTGSLVTGVAISITEGPDSISTSIASSIENPDINIISRMGDLPIMVMSERCHLRGCKPTKLVELKEEANEVGGYFVMNGIERCVRLLQVPRRNYATAIQRSSYKNRGSSYSDRGVAMRCVRQDQSSVTITLHYLNNGGATLKFVLRKQEFLLPVVIVAKALMDITDKELFDRVAQGDLTNTFMTARLELLLRDAKSYNCNTKAECASFLGSHFRGFLPCSDRTSDEEAGYLLLERYIYVHASEPAEKLECLLHMLRKLFSFAQDKCLADNADALMNHEILMPGHLITMYVKEKLEETFLTVKQSVGRDYRMNKQKCLLDLKNPKYYQRMFDRFGGGIGGRIGTFLSTGNIISSTGLDLMQVSGYTIVAERLNIFRYMSHFQSVHRGQFFTTMKTTAVRKLLPESWGFLCPVHTPDGSPCGLLNHLARECVVLAFPTTDRLPTTPGGILTANVGNGNKWLVGNGLKQLLMSLGVMPAGVNSGDGQLLLGVHYLPVLIDGIVIGGVHNEKVANIVAQLRVLKITGGLGDSKYQLDPTMEIALIPKFDLTGAYPGLYIFTSPGRMVRPVLHLKEKRIEYIGPMEQVYMGIACLTTDIIEETTHIETNPGVMLSQVASMTPFSDYNQSPRNMYQCQMGKQTMGTPAHAMKSRSDNKMYRIQNPQAPIVQTQSHRDYQMDEYPQGTNAVVAVISYTGYDMEDAMIISKGSFERGFGHGSVYKTFVIDLEEEEKRLSQVGSKPALKFCNVKQHPLNSDNNENDMVGEKYCEELDFDGLPHEGEMVEYGNPICCFVDTINGDQRTVKHKDNENAYVDTVRVIGSTVGGSGTGKKGGPVRKVSITLRYRRNPIIGDKFSSRHGQKGTLSLLYPQENMPFSESGMCPDILINPHAFPSRMTIGMLVESMAGKSGAMHGMFQDSTPFQFHEKDKAIDYMGDQLLASGYHYYGSEPLYSGLTGNIMKADIFMGLVYYQRLRHMVSDKSQVRSTGPVMAITRQPVKGRKKGGGIRLGEMERDALISHGVSFCLHDRLMTCSDIHLAYVCDTCGSLLNVFSQSSSNTQGINKESIDTRGNNNIFNKTRVQTCNGCKSDAGVRPVHLPYVYRYLTNELAGMGIKMSLKLSE